MLEGQEVVPSEVTPEVEPQTPPAEAATTPPETGEAPAPVEGEAPPPAAYAPSYGYKVYGSEKELPEWVRPLIINKDAEDVFRELYSKADAFEVLKEKNSSFVKQYEQLNSQVAEQYVPVMQDLKSAASAVKNGDLGKAFEILGIDEKQALKWAVDKARYQEMTAEEKSSYDARIRIMRENEELRQKNEGLSSTHQKFQVEQRERELDLVLQRPEIVQVMQQFDQRRGRIGAFRDEVVTYAIGKYHTAGEDIPADKAVESVLTLLGQSGQANQPRVQPEAPAAKPVIPNFKSGHTSGVRKTPNSIEGLRKLAESL